MKLPAKITAFTGMDALTHAIEGITSTGAEPIADALGLHAIRLIFKYLPIAVKNPEDITARGQHAHGEQPCRDVLWQHHDRRGPCNGPFPGCPLRNSTRARQRHHASRRDGFQRI
ncbi:MAG: iron-containing alcohol dehydrogenase [Desulfobacterales bacterium]|nr:iron-containing alcohol dehydrogenase [Desulfobacterales bacterium]